MAFNTFGMFGSQAPVFGGNFSPSTLPAPFRVMGSPMPNFGNAPMNFLPAYQPQNGHQQQGQGQGQGQSGNINGIGKISDNIAYQVRQPFLPSAQTSNIMGDAPDINAAASTASADISSGLDLSSLAALFG